MDQPKTTWADVAIHVLELGTANWAALTRVCALIAAAW
jgi:hypothetical protein